MENKILFDCCANRALSETDAFSVRASDGVYVFYETVHRLIFSDPAALSMVIERLKNKIITAGSVEK